MGVGGHPDRRRSSARQQGHASRYQHGGEPSAAINFFVKENLGGEGVANECQRRGRGRDQADISPGQREQQTEESHRHGGDTETEAGITHDATDDGPESRVAPKFVYVANLLHRPCQQNVSHHRREHHHQNAAPCVEIAHGFTPPETLGRPLGSETPLPDESARTRVSSSAVSVSAGPPATNPTPPAINAMPSQRIRLTCSWRAKRATSASKTYPSDVAGNT